MDGAFKVFDSVAWKAFSQLRRQTRSLTALTSLTSSSKIPSPPEHVTSISLLPIRRVPYFPTDPPRCFEGHRKILKHIWGETWAQMCSEMLKHKYHLCCWNAPTFKQHQGSSITAASKLYIELLKSDNFRCLQLGRSLKEDMCQLLPSHSQRGVESEINNSTLEQSISTLRSQQSSHDPPSLSHKPPHWLASLCHKLPPLP